jgi:hypothetical protein
MRKRTFAKSGGRQPAVVWIRTCDGDRLLRSDYVSARTFASPTTAGSRQPLLVARAQVAANARWCFATAYRSPRGAYAPRSCIAVRMSAGEKRFLRCVNVHSPRAAGVIPPWFGFALATATGFCGVIMFRPAHSPPLPRLAHASRSWFRHGCSCRSAFPPGETATCTTAGLRQPLLVAGAAVVADVRFG